jgi:para-aminobenzoate synthetase component 1
MDKQEAIFRINQLATQKIPFLFIIDYDFIGIEVIPINEIDSNEILYSIQKSTNISEIESSRPNALTQFNKSPIAFEEYQKTFNKVMYHLKRGDSYLTNLTCSTPIQCNLTLRDIFIQSTAKYRLFFKDQFVVFSPETFFKIEDGRIYSFPMKGTVDASIENAVEQILSSPKEAAEHATIVDLIRNDLSKVASEVRVDKYRYIDVLRTNMGELLQVSSQISGKLPADYLKELGELIFELLPAGSISGAPKDKTLKIIAASETHERGYYTGVFGVFNGKEIDCGVMIRFIEKIDNQLVFKSGGGITANSNVQSEYDEMIQKVYLPF